MVLPGGAIDRIHEVFTKDTVYVDRLADLPAGRWVGSPRDQVRAHYLLRTPANDPGNPVSYGSSWTPPELTRVVTLPAGYGDGYMRAMSGKAEVILHGKRYPVVDGIPVLLADRAI